MCIWVIMELKQKKTTKEINRKRKVNRTSHPTVASLLYLSISPLISFISALWWIYLPSIFIFPFPFFPSWAAPSGPADRVVLHLEHDRSNLQYANSRGSNRDLVQVIYSPIRCHNLSNEAREPNANCWHSPSDLPPQSIPGRPERVNSCSSFTSSILVFRLSREEPSTCPSRKILFSPRFDFIGWVRRVQRSFAQFL